MPPETTVEEDAEAVFTLLLDRFGMNNLTGLSTYLGAEGLWFKCRKHGAYYLTIYAYNRDESEYKEFQKCQEILFDVKRTRLELEKIEPDLDIAYKGFRQLGIHQKDLEIMATLFRRFRNFEHVALAMDLWGRADVLVSELQVLGENLHRQISAVGYSQKNVDEFEHEIENLNDKLNTLEDEFSSALEEASKWVKGLLERS